VTEERYRFELLRRHHKRTEFSSGVEPLDRYLREQARQDARNHVTAVHVMQDIEESRIAGYFTSSAASIEPIALPTAVARSLPRYPSLPAFLLGRFALDTRYQGQGLGGLLLVHALRLALTVSSQVAAMAVIVDAKDSSGRRFYERFGFESIVGDEYRLFIPMRRISQV
jgi:GNAT superfamily N-acetyltransferase